MNRTNAFDSDLTVDVRNDLGDVHVAPLNDGSTAWVSATQESYRLYKNGPLSPVLVDGVAAIAPFAGSPIAGNPLAVWIREEGNFCGSFFGALADPVTGLGPDMGTGPGPWVNLVTLVVPVTSLDHKLAITASLSGTLDADSHELPAQMQLEYQVLVNGVVNRGGHLAGDSAVFQWPFGDAIVTRFDPVALGDQTIIWRARYVGFADGSFTITPGDNEHATLLVECEKQG